MAATVEVCESNGVGETITHDVSNINMGDNDSANLTPATYPITAAENAYEKYIRFHVTAMGGSNAIDNLKVWMTGGLDGNLSMDTCCRESSYVQKTYVQPVKTTSTQATEVMPTTEPSGANLGIAGSLAGQLTAAGYSDYAVHQLQVGGAAGPGDMTQQTFHHQYDEQ